ALRSRSDRAPSGFGAACAFLVRVAYPAGFYPAGRRFESCRRPHFLGELTVQETATFAKRSVRDSAHGNRAHSSPPRAWRKGNVSVFHTEVASSALAARTNSPVPLVARRPAFQADKDGS